MCEVPVPPRWRVRPIARRLVLTACGAATAVALAACGPQPGAVDVEPAGYVPELGYGPEPGFEADLATDPLLAADAVLAPEPAIAADPTGGSRRLLPNATALPGENFVTTVPAGRFGGQSSVAQVLSRAGVLPSPFEFAIARDFAPAPGVPGTSYVFATPQDGVTCVLAIAPAATGALMMRNCVPGGTAEALAPLASSSIL